MANRSGDRGRPYLGPRFSSKKGDMLLLVCIAAKGTEYETFIQEIKLDPKPNFLRAKNRKSHLTHSNVFSASSDIMTSEVPAEKHYKGYFQDFGY